MKITSKAIVFMLTILFLSLIVKAEANGESTQTATLTAIDSNLTSQPVSFAGWT